MQAGDILAGKYQIVRRLGEGGEGSVYLAIHLQTEMFWAIKEIRVKEGGSGSSPCHELQMMKRLKNRHLPQIIDVVAQEESVCLVMEHVRGIPMNLRLRNGQVLSFREVWDVAEQVTEALCYLESREKPVCHLDIKPSNLILRPDGLIKLVDFGSAWKELEEMTQKGTEGYAAPEQYRTDGVKPDVRTDIYGLGATLYRMISGKTWSAAMRQSSVPNCPAEMSDLIRRCLREDPDQRYQSAAALKEALAGMRRREKKEGGRRQLLGALAMALPAAALCLQILPHTIDLSADESWNYEKLVREAGVVGREESLAYYRKAFFLEPGRKEAYLRYLEDVQTDGVFSEEEETFLRDTLHTVRPGMEFTYEELLEKEADAYQETAFQIALAYWYSCPREDNRRIALGWFEKAAGAGGDTKSPDGSVEGSEAGRKAQLYLRLGNTLEKIRSLDDEDAAVNALEYWEDLGRILETYEDGTGLEDPLTQLKFYRESLSMLTFLAGDLERAGVGSKTLSERIRKMEELARKVPMPSERSRQKEEILKEIQKAANMALEAAEHVTREETELPEEAEQSEGAELSKGTELSKGAELSERTELSGGTDLSGETESGGRV